jgi:hypothetical protein
VTVGGAGIRCCRNLQETKGLLAQLFKRTWIIATRKKAQGTTDGATPKLGRSLSSLRIHPRTVMEKAGYLTSG